MFENKGGVAVPGSERMDGTKAERKVLGYLDNAGFSFLREDPKLKEEVLKIVETLQEKGYFDKFLRIYHGEDRTEEEQFQIAFEHVMERFIEVNFIKNAESGSVPDRLPQEEKDIDAMLKGVYSIRMATSQVQRIANFNKEHDLGYYEKISTPFTERLMSSLKQRFKTKEIEAQILYTSAIFENDSLKTHLDGIRGIDSYLIVIVDGKPRIFYIDYTADPKKAVRESIDRGNGVHKTTSADLAKGDAKFLVYIDFEHLADEAVLARTGDMLAKEIEAEYA